MADPIDRIAGRLPGPLVPAWRLSAHTVRSTIDDRVHGLAAEAAFFAILSLPPMILAVVGSIGFVAEALGPEVRASIEGAILGIPRLIFAPDTMEVIEPILAEVLREGRGDIVGIGFLIALWGGSRAINVYLEALAIAYGVNDPRPTWRRRGLAYVLTLAGAVIGAVVIPALVLGPDLVDWLLNWAPGPIDQAAVSLAERAFWPVLGLITVVMLTAFYDIGVPWRTPLHRDLPGAVLAMLLWVLGGIALRIYADISIRADGGIYGPLAAPLVVLLWLYVTAFAVLLGAELNSEIEHLWPHRDRRTRGSAEDPARVVEEPAAPA